MITQQIAISAAENIGTVTQVYDGALTSDIHALSKPTGKEVIPDEDFLRQQRSHFADDPPIHFTFAPPRLQRLAGECNGPRRPAALLIVPPIR